MVSVTQRAGAGAWADLGASRRRLVRALAVSAITLDLMLVELVTPLVPEIKARTGAGGSALGLALAAYAFPLLVLSLPLGRLADAVGRLPLLAGGLVVTTAGSIVLALAQSLELFAAGRVLQGVGSAASWIAALAVVADLAPPERRGEALGTAIAATAFGSVAGPAFGGALADLVSYEAPFLIVSGLGLLLTAGTLAWVPPGAPEHVAPGPVLAATRDALRSGAGRAGALLVLGASTSLGLFGIVAPLDFNARLGLGAAAIGAVFALVILADSTALLLGGRWGDRSGRRLPAVVGLVACIGCAAMLFGVPGLVGSVVAAAIYGGGQGLVYSSGVPWLDDAFGAGRRGAAYALLNILFAAGYVVGPALGGVLYDAGGRRLSYAVFGGVYVMTLAAVLAARSAR